MSAALARCSCALIERGDVMLYDRHRAQWVHERCGGAVPDAVVFDDNERAARASAAERSTDHDREMERHWPI